MNELTLEQHLQNISIAVENATGTYNELTAIRKSYLHIRDLVLAADKKETKEVKDSDIIKP